MEEMDWARFEPTTSARLSSKIARSLIRGSNYGKELNYSNPTRFTLSLFAYSL
jgi:hypothetical protein